MAASLHKCRRGFEPRRHYAPVNRWWQDPSSIAKKTEYLPFVLFSPQKNTNPQGLKNLGGLDSQVRLISSCTVE